MEVLHQFYGLIMGEKIKFNMELAEVFSRSTHFIHKYTLYGRLAHFIYPLDLIVV